MLPLVCIYAGCCGVHMRLKIQKRNGREYLSVVQNYRQNGKTMTRTVETIGYADTFAESYDDPIAHFRCYVDQLNKEESARKRPIELSFAHDDVIAPSADPSARLGAAVALGCLDAIGVRDFFRARSGHEGFRAHEGRVFEMLAAERMMHATSKRESWTSRESFPRTCDFSFEDVYAALPCFSREEAHLDAAFLRNWSRIGGEPDVSRIFLICGSYAFPVDGGSKRASIAVALDPNTMPIGYHVFEGRIGPETLRQAVDVLKERLGAERAVVVAGGLRDLEPTIAELARTGDGFALYQRDFESAPSLASWAQDEEGYQAAGENVSMKWRTSERPLPDGGGVPVKEIVLRGGGYAVQRRHAALVSSELDMSEAAIVQLYRELWRQAEPFQPLEADFSSMPYPTSAHDHVHAHFALCYAAFLALRLLRWKAGWGHNAADTADALLRMEGAHLQRNYYLFNYRSDVTDDIENALGIPPARRLRTRAELRAVPSLVRQAFAERPGD